MISIISEISKVDCKFIREKHIHQMIWTMYLLPWSFITSCCLCMVPLIVAVGGGVPKKLHTVGFPVSYYDAVFS